MRIDKFLKLSRIIKRRTVANEACDMQRVKVNGRDVKASYNVKLGDVVEIAFGAKNLTFEICDLSENLPKDKCAQMYRVIDS